MSAKHRLSASIDADLIATAQAAVTAGRAETVSAYVNDALRLKADHDRRLAALEDIVAAYEHEHGEISDEEMHRATHAARGRAVVVRGRPQEKPAQRGRGVA